MVKNLKKPYLVERQKPPLYTTEVDVKYPKKIHYLHSDLPFLPKRIKVDKCKKLVCNLHNKKNTSYI